MPNPLFQSKTHGSGGSMPFRSRTWHVAKTGIKADLMHEFMPLEPFFVFFSKHVHSTTFGVKLMFGWFRAISLPHLTRCENLYRGAFNAQVYAPKPFLVWPQRTFSVHNFRSKTHVLGGFVPFCSRTWHIAKTVIEAHLMHEFMPL